MKKILFVVSDIHGHYSEMKKALDSAGFDPENETHVFVNCGDLFDRGAENTEVYRFVNSLKRKILIRGNHEDILYRILKNKKITYREVWNGTDITLRQLIGEDSIDSDFNFVYEPYEAKIEEILDFIDSMINYYETEKYVFTHGWLPVEIFDRTPEIIPNWREADALYWKDARWLQWQEMYGVGALLDDKTIVCGHRPTSMGDMYDTNREPDDSSIFYGDRMIAIDACTVRSGRVNVLVVEDNG